MRMHEAEGSQTCRWDGAVGGWLIVAMVPTPFSPFSHLDIDALVSEGSGISKLECPSLFVSTG